MCCLHLTVSETWFLYFIIGSQRWLLIERMNRSQHQDGWLVSLVVIIWEPEYIIALFSSVNGKTQNFNLASFACYSELFKIISCAEPTALLIRPSC